MAENKCELKDNDLSNVSGGTFSWESFTQIFLESIKNYTGPITADYKKLIEALKNKDYVTAATVAIPLIAQDDKLLMEIIKQCMMQSL